jgi:hypothetical protein
MKKVQMKRGAGREVEQGPTALNYNPEFRQGSIWRNFDFNTGEAIKGQHFDVNIRRAA